jgi:hypothetical protein
MVVCDSNTQEYKLLGMLIPPQIIGLSTNHAWLVTLQAWHSLTPPISLYCGRVPEGFYTATGVKSHLTTVHSWSAAKAAAGVQALLRRVHGGEVNLNDHARPEDPNDHARPEDPDDWQDEEWQPMDIDDPTNMDVDDPSIEQDGPIPPSEQPRGPERVYHPFLTGMLIYSVPYYDINSSFSGAPCDERGALLEAGSGPTPQQATENPAHPFEDADEFELAEWVFKEAELSNGKIDDLFRIWANHARRKGGGVPYRNAKDVYKLIDAIDEGVAPWKVQDLCYTGVRGQKCPKWQKQKYELYYRDPDAVVKHMLANPDYDGFIDYQPYQEFNAAGRRRYGEFMSGLFSWRQAVSFRHFDSRSRSY